MHMKVNMRIVGALGLLAVLLSQCTSSRAQGQADTQYVPSSTTVAILPVVDRTGVKDGFDTEKLQKAVTDELIRQFSGRGFKIINGKVIDEVTARLKIDLKDEEQQKRAIIRSVGKESGADLVAFVTVMDVHSVSEGGWAISSTVASSKVKCWLLDTNSERALMSGKVETANNDSFFELQGIGGQAGKIIRASAQAVRQAFDRALKPYPRIQKEGKAGN